ncbi:radical SAM protein [Youngiibacter fragilis]|uniref:Fe-S oxidoreductase n=1 Tax=Youngiibacter fragilis 232.1 TaxID=994573 RepID=V7IBJ9_9CLOT|nr:radical SAM protein [Youngiibacter fragilis]ETA82247.1 Fe-S oxidoreductase [Youngiibacter fragilis 232.1]
MIESRYIYGPVPSRRLGISLGISPIPKKTCNYSCIYCQLGRTDKMVYSREMFVRIDDILDEFEKTKDKVRDFDAVTIVGEGEPTLYLGLGKLIRGLKDRTDKPVAVITNGALLSDPEVREELMAADIVLPSADAWDKESFRKINRPIGLLNYWEVRSGLVEFSKNYEGQLWLEIMLMKGINDSHETLQRYRELLKEIRYVRLYINTPVRPPAEDFVRYLDREDMERAEEILGGTSIDLLVSEGFQSVVEDDLEAVVGIIKRHPMNRFEIEGFLAKRGTVGSGSLLEMLVSDARVETLHYKGIDTYRLK